MSEINIKMKNPYKINSCQNGVAWQKPFSKINGPSFPILTKNPGEQFSPMLEAKGSKLLLKINENIKNDKNKTMEDFINLNIVDSNLFLNFSSEFTRLTTKNIIKLKPI